LQHCFIEALIPAAGLVRVFCSGGGCFGRHNGSLLLLLLLTWLLLRLGGPSCRSSLGSLGR
jgi:hypothetical protein